MAGTYGFYQTAVDVGAGCAYQQPVCMTSAISGALGEFGSVKVWGENDRILDGAVDGTARSG